MARTKLMILGDNPNSTTGLARILRELCQRTHSNLSDEFELCTYGFSGTYSRKFPWIQYEMSTKDMVPTNLPSVWRDFAGDEHGVVLSIWNPSLLWWMADPSQLKDERLKAFLETRPFERWIYAPIDGDFQPGRLPQNIAECILGFDRVAVYTEWAKNLVKNAGAINYKEIAALPHGLDTSVFYPRPRQEARDTFVNRVAELNANPLADVLMVGVIATSTPRKDWYLAFEVCAELLRRNINVGVWAHVDKLRGNWDIPALVKEFGLEDRVISSNRALDDETMAWAYSAMDVTLGIGSGEGWGYPLAESLACGTPVIHGNYAGGAEFVPKRFLVEPAAFRGDSFFGLRRPCFHARDWAEAVVLAMYSRNKRVNVKPSLLPTYIDWNNCWPRWSSWLLEGKQ